MSKIIEGPGGMPYKKDADKKMDDPFGIYKTSEEEQQSDLLALLAEDAKIPEEPKQEDINLDIQDDRILLQDFPVREKVGSIYTPQNEEIFINKARVVGIGHVAQQKMPHLKIGMVVVKAFGLGQTLTMKNGAKFIFLPSNSVIAIDRDYNPPLPIKE